MRGRVIGNSSMLARIAGFLMNVGHAKTRRREELKTVVRSRRVLLGNLNRNEKQLSSPRGIKPVPRPDPESRQGAFAVREANGKKGFSPRGGELLPFTAALQWVTPFFHTVFVRGEIFHPIRVCRTCRIVKRFPTSLAPFARESVFISFSSAKITR
jgi:hypothetical protein